jgi:DNA-binding transcriptional ArsR family regulator
MPGPRPTVAASDRVAKRTTIRLTVLVFVHTFNNMVELQESGLDAVFHALGDVTRRRMLHSLSQGERTVGQLAEPFQMSLAAASKHVKALESAGLIRREVRGRQHICRLEAGPLSTAHDWLRVYEQFWTARLDRLEDLLRQDMQRSPPPAAAPAATEAATQPATEPAARARPRAQPKRRPP